MALQDRFYCTFYLNFSTSITVHSHWQIQGVSPMPLPSPIGPNYFIFTCVFTKKHPRRTLAPPSPPPPQTGNPGSAIDSSSVKDGSKFLPQKYSIEVNHNQFLCTEIVAKFLDKVFLHTHSPLELLFSVLTDLKSGSQRNLQEN